MTVNFVCTENNLIFVYMRVWTELGDWTKEENSYKYETENSDNLTKGLKMLHLKYTQNRAVAHINVNTIRNKFVLLVPQIASNVDVLVF